MNLVGSIFIFKMKYELLKCGCQVLCFINGLLIFTENEPQSLHV